MDRYEVAVEKETFLDLTIAQLGLDVAVDLFDPEQRLVLQVDSPSGDRGVEIFTAILPASGVYRLEVRPAEAGESGEYAMRVDALRPPVDRDRLRDRAFRQQVQGDRLRRDGDFQEALPLCREAVDLWRQAEDRRGESWSGHRVGLLQERLEDPQGALTTYRQAAVLAHRAGALHEEAVLWNRIGLIHRDLRQPAEALDAFYRSAGTFERLGEATRWAAVLNRAASVHELRGQAWQALTLYRRLLAFWQDAEDAAGEATARNNLGELYLRLAQNRLARDQFQLALGLRRRAGDIRGEAITLTSLGTAYRRLGLFDRAVACFERALALQRHLADPEKEINTLNGLGLTELKRSRFDRSRQLFDEALALARSTGDSRAESYVLLNLGEWTESHGRPQAALGLYRRAQLACVEIGDRGGEAIASYGIARAERRLGRKEAALAAVQRAVDLVDDLRGDAGADAHKSSFFAFKRDYFELAIDLLVDLDPADGPAGGGNGVAALLVSERSRARSLLDSLAEPLRQGEKPADSGMARQERELQARLRQGDEEALPLPGADPETSSSQIHAHLRRLVAELGEVRASRRAAARGGAPHAGRPPPHLIERVRDKLGPDTVILEFFLGRERSFLWLLTHDSLEVFVLPPRREIERLARLGHRLLAGSHNPGLRAQLGLVLEAMSHQLLGPVAARLEGRRIVVIPDGALQYVPFAVLPEPRSLSKGTRRPLVADHEVVVLPSLAVLELLRVETARRPRPPRTLAVLADPVFEPGDPRLAGAAADSGSPPCCPRLPATADEAAAILALVPAPQRLASLGFAAHPDLVRSGGLASYRILHFATHSQANTALPELNAIYLSHFDESGQPRDGVLYAHEIASLDLPADLAVLSACSTGLGQEVDGEGLLGLPRAFMLAGTARTVVSLWNVDDRATTELMRRFYSALLRDGMSPAAALRRAQLAMRAEPRWQAPYYWAGFVLQGDWH